MNAVMTSFADSESGGELPRSLLLRRQIRELSEHDRFLLGMPVVDGWDYADIAARVGMPRAALLQRVREIRAELRRKFKPVYPRARKPTTDSLSAPREQPRASVPIWLHAPALYLQNDHPQVWCSDKS